MEKERVETFSQTDPPFPALEDRKPVPKDKEMIIFVGVSLKEIFKKQRKFVWPRPDGCPRCRMSKLWGHGYVEAYFDDLTGPVYLRRYRCPECRCVIRLRPKGYFPRIQASIETIRTSLGHRLREGRWPAGTSRSRQRHWLNRLITKTIGLLGNAWKDRLLEAFDRLLCLGMVSVSRTIEPGTGVVFEPPYRSVP